MTELAPAPVSAGAVIKPFSVSLCIGSSTIMACYLTTIFAMKLDLLNNSDTELLRSLALLSCLVIHCMSDPKADKCLRPWVRSVWLCREHQCHLTSTGMSTKESSARRVLDEGRELTEYISYLEMRSLFDKHMHRLLFCKFATLAVGMQPAGHVTCTCGS